MIRSGMGTEVIRTTSRSGPITVRRALQKSKTPTESPAIRTRFAMRWNSPGPSPCRPVLPRNTPPGPKNRTSAVPLLATTIVPLGSRVTSATRKNSWGIPVPDSARSRTGSGSTVQPAPSAHWGAEDSTMVIPALSRRTTAGTPSSVPHPANAAAAATRANLITATDLAPAIAMGPATASERGRAPVHGRTRIVLRLRCVLITDPASKGLRRTAPAPPPRPRPPRRGPG